MFNTTADTGMWASGPLMMLVVAAAIIVPFWFIFSKAGYSKWLSLFMIFPLVNVILFYFLAFSKWPSLRNATAST